MLNKENMLKWADALESGKYLQNTGSYGSGFHGFVNEFCCLHVAAEIAGKRFIATCDAEPFLEKHYGLESCQQFIEFNDRDGLTFPEIATEIRKMVNG